MSDDYVMVPREPTPEMLAAILEPIKWAGGVCAYRAMIAAAPPAAPAVPLTDADIDRIADRLWEQGHIQSLSKGTARIFARAVLSAAHVVSDWDKTLRDAARRSATVVHSGKLAAPVVREPLTDAFIDDIASAVFDLHDSERPAMEPFRAQWLESVGRPLARAIERAHGIGGGNG